MRKSISTRYLLRGVALKQLRSTHTQKGRKAMSFEQFMIEFLSCKREEYIRVGQHVSTFLHKTRPDIANKICGTMEDCFCVDVRIPAFLDKVKELW